MGVDCEIYLPEHVRVSDVGKLLGILSGCKKQRMRLGESLDSGWAVGVAGVQVIGIPQLPECCHVDWIDSQESHCRWLFHFEPTRPGRLMMPRSTAKNIALGRALVDFYGGSVFYQDCESRSAPDYELPWIIRPDFSDNAVFRAWQEKLWAVEPLSPEQIDACRGFAAYSNL